MAKRQRKSKAPVNNKIPYSASQPLTQFQYTPQEIYVLLDQAFTDTFRNYPQLGGDRIYPNSQGWMRKIRYDAQTNQFNWHKVILDTVEIRELDGQVFRINGDGTTAMVKGLLPNGGKFIPKVKLHHYRVNTVRQALEIYCKIDVGRPRSKARRIIVRLKEPGLGYEGATERDINLLQKGLNIWLSNGVQDLTDDELVIYLRKGGRYYATAQLIIQLFSQFRRDKTMGRFLRPAVTAALFAAAFKHNGHGLNFWSSIFSGFSRPGVPLRPGSLAAELRDRIINIIVITNRGTRRKHVEKLDAEEAFRVFVWYYEFVRTGTRVGKVARDKVYKRPRPAGY